MDTWVWIVIAVAAVVIVAIAAMLIVDRRRQQHLRERFGPEYDRAVERADSRRQANRELADREKRHDALQLRPLTPGKRDRYAQEWTALQSRFVDRPQAVVAEADELLAQLMADRGYPADRFETQADAISVDHPDLVENYRVAHSVQERTAGGEASTEDLRRAVVSYRNLFDELLRDGDTAGAASEASESATSRSR
jgi:hypothetical protein